jgi:hypothetical protein
MQQAPDRRRTLPSQLAKPQAMESSVASTGCYQQYPWQLNRFIARIFISRGK